MCLGEAVKAHTTDCSIVNQEMYLMILLQKPLSEASDRVHRAQVHLTKQETVAL